MTDSVPGKMGSAVGGGVGDPASPCQSCRGVFLRRRLGRLATIAQVHPKQYETCVKSNMSPRRADHSRPHPRYTMSPNFDLTFST
jgi:hypothetical protein